MTITTLTTEKLTDTVGATILDVDADRIRRDVNLPEAVMCALDENGVLLFPELHLDDETQVEFCRKLGQTVQFPGMEIPEIWVISLDPEKNRQAEYLHGTFEWHIDGTLDQNIPSKASLLSAKVLSEAGGDTEFASTYAAHDALSDEEKQRYANLRVYHSFAASQRPVYPNPTPLQVDVWTQRGGREHPLVWTHETGRQSLVLGSSADYICGMDIEEGRALLAYLNARATTPTLVYRHRWTVGDTLIWDNCGVMHRVKPYDPTSRRELHRTTIMGDEAIK